MQLILKPSSDEPLPGPASDSNAMDLTEVDIRLPMLVYVSHEKQLDYDHNRKSGAMNALVRALAIPPNRPFILNLDCDHYISNSEAVREGIFYMMDCGGNRIFYVQFPQRFEGIDPSNRDANHNTVFFNVNMQALDGILGPVYVGTGCLFRRTALYDFVPPFKTKNSSIVASVPLRSGGSIDNEEMSNALIPRKFSNSSFFVDSIRVAEFQG